MANSYSESIVDPPCLPTPSVPITISSSHSPLLSITPVRYMDTANFINIEFRVCYSFLKNNIFSVKARESFVVVQMIEEILLENRQRVSSTRLSKTLTFASYTKTMQNGVGEVAEVSYYYYSRDSHEIVQKFLCMKVAKFSDWDQMFWDVLPTAPCGCFWMLHPAKGYHFHD